MPTCALLSSPLWLLLWGQFSITYGKNISASSNLTTDISTSTLTAASESLVYGWVDQPNTRGTFTIAWSCLCTIFICTYTMLCINVPSEGETASNIVRRRLWWMIIAIAGPEFMLTCASGQLGSAKISVKAFRALYYSQWTLRHGFFADMGGFLLVPLDCTPSPVTAKQIHWLVTHNYMHFPEVTSAEMEDRSKQDTVEKVVTCFQISYRVFDCISRAAQQLTITTMELFTLAIVVCSIMTSLCWLHKPSDVRTQIKLRLNTSLEDVLKQAGQIAAQPQKQTPLDFIDDLCPSWSLNVQPFMACRCHPNERPLPRLGNDRLPSFKGYQHLILCVATLLYAAIHLGGWNSLVPLKSEKIMWRGWSIFLFGNTVAFWVFETSAAWYRIGGLQRF